MATDIRENLLDRTANDLWAQANVSREIARSWAIDGEDPAVIRELLEDAHRIELAAADVASVGRYDCCGCCPVGCCCPRTHTVPPPTGRRGVLRLWRR